MGMYQPRAMKTGARAIALLFYFAVFVNGEELPKAFVEGLAAEDFKVREDSQSKLLEWAKAKEESAAPALLKLSRTSEEPEVRQRCLDVLKDLSDQDYLSGGKGFLGITMQAEEARLPGKENPVPAVRINSVVKNGPAEKVGLDVGDSIITLNGVAFQGNDVLSEFSGAIGGMKPLDKVVLGIRRANGNVEDVNVVLARHPGENLAVFPQNLHLLDERAREQHFEMWLKELDR